MKTFGVYNLKGGVGKTTTAVNLAYLAAKEGKRTLLWDLDPQRATTFYLKIMPAAKPSAKALIQDKTMLDRLIKPTEYANLDLFPAHFKIRHLDAALGEMKRRKKQLTRLIDTLAARYDYLFLDCPPTLSFLSENVFQAADYLIIPVIPTTLSLQTFKQVKKYLNKHFSNPAKLIPFFSMVDSRKILHRKTMEALNTTTNFCATTIPSRAVIEQMGTHRAPVPHFSPKSDAAQDYQALWKEIQHRIGYNE